MTYTLEQANSYINESSIDKKFYPKINFAAPTGWINDPNGISIYQNEYHLFYQYFPYGPMHGSMHWGHAKSVDGLNWDHLPVALAPDEKYDNGGVFSGSAIESNDQLVLFYTGNLPSIPEEESRQNQNIAISKDGIHFEKIKQNPVLDESDLPAKTSKVHFRDPKIVKYNGSYYAVIGSKSEDNIGQILLYQSNNLINWEFVNIILKDVDYLGDMAECPDLLLLGGKDVIVVSAMNYIEDGKAYPHKTLLIEGNMNWDKYIFEPDNKREMDLGLDYYAPQTAREEDGSYFAIAWQQSWGKTHVPAVLGHGWMGQMTIPQSIYFQNDKVYRSIHPKVLSNKKKINSYQNITEEHEINLDKSQFIELKLKMSDCQNLSLSFCNEMEDITLELDFNSKSGSFSRENTKYNIQNHDGTSYNSRNFIFDINEPEMSMQIILDSSSIQVYLNNYVSISSTFYSENPLEQIKVMTDKGSKVDLIELYTIKEVS